MLSDLLKGDSRTVKVDGGWNVNGPPKTLETGKIFFLNTSPTGAWAGQTGLASWNGERWEFLSKTDLKGFTLVDTATGTQYTHNGSTATSTVATIEAEAAEAIAALTFEPADQAIAVWDAGTSRFIFLAKPTGADGNYRIRCALGGSGTTWTYSWVAE